MTIQQCRYILGVADAGSFSEAAKQLFVAQSAISGSVKSLESELSIKIFERAKNGVFLTPEGAELVRYARQIVEQHDFLVRHFQTDPLRERLYVSTQHYDFVADIFCRLVCEMEGDYDLSLRETRTYDVIREVETVYSDIGILAIREKDMDVMTRYLSRKGLAFTQFLKAAPHVYVRRQHSLAARPHLVYEDLTMFPYISYEQGNHNSSFFVEELTEDWHLGRRVEISDRATLMNVLLTTDGYTIGTGIMPSALNDGKLLGIPLVSDDQYRIGYILRSDRAPSPLVSRLISRLTQFGDEYAE